jgi:hypothetical protein
MAALQTPAALMEPPLPQVPPELPAQQPAEEPEPPSPYGENNEDLPLPLQALLKRLALMFSDEDKFGRRVEIQESKRAHWFWDSLQHQVWDARSEGWLALGPNGAPLIDGGSRKSYNTDSAVMYTTNIYQPFGLTLMSVLTQSLPAVRFEPEDPSEAADLATAKAANRMKKIIEHDNDVTTLLTKAMFFAYVDGRVHAYTRTEEDPRTGALRQKITVHGSLEFKVPLTADEQDDFVYCQYSNEQHVAMAKHENPKFADKIRGGAIGNGQDVYERTARISVKLGTSFMSGSGDTLQNQATKQQTWMRPAAFEMLKDDGKKDDPDIQELEQLFPTGCRVAIISGEYVGSWDESMDDHVSVMNALPGDGQKRNAMGTTTISVQERFNDIINIAQDVYEKTLPASWQDSEMVDADGVFRQQSMPGAKYPAKKRQGEALAESFFFEPAASVSPDMLNYAEQLMGPVPQFLTGAFPALFGGGEAKGAAGDTASGYAMQRDQAMGRIGLVWRSTKRWWARVMEQAIRCAADRDEDASIAIPDASGNVETTKVRIEELQGNVCCYPESEEGIPQSLSEQRGAYMALLPMADQNPLLASTLSLPENQELAQRLIGLNDFKLAGADSWAKQKLEINELLESAAVPNPKFEQLEKQHQALSAKVAAGQIVPDQEIAQLAQELAVTRPKTSSITIDAECDDNPSEWMTVKVWMSTSEGLREKVENPDGFDNVRLHGLEHRDAAKAEAMANMPPAPPQHPPTAPPHTGAAPHPAGPKPNGPPMAKAA